MPTKALNVCIMSLRFWMWGTPQPRPPCQDLRISPHVYLRGCLPHIHSSVASYEQESPFNMKLCCFSYSFWRFLGLTCWPGHPLPPTSPPQLIQGITTLPPRTRYLLAHGMHYCSGQKFNCPSSQRFFLPLRTEHLQFLCLLLNQSLAVPHLHRRKQKHPLRHTASLTNSLFPELSFRK